jgi:hypothetical protein
MLPHTKCDRSRKKQKVLKKPLHNHTKMERQVVKKKPYNQKKKKERKYDQNSLIITFVFEIIDRAYRQMTANIKVYYYYYYSVSPSKDRQKKLITSYSSTNSYSKHFFFVPFSQIPLAAQPLIHPSPQKQAQATTQYYYSI